MRGIHLSPVNSPHKGQWRGALMFTLICAWTNGLVNNRDAGDLRRHRAHYDITVMPRNVHAVFLGNHRSRQWHDDVIKWKHSPRCWPFVRRIHRSPVYSSHKGQWRGALMFSSICAWINDWVNNREAGDLVHHRAPLLRHCNGLSLNRRPTITVKSILQNTSQRTFIRNSNISIITMTS